MKRKIVTVIGICASIGTFGAIALIAVENAQALTTTAKMGTKAEEVAGTGSTWTNVGNLTTPAQEATSSREGNQWTKPVLVSGFGFAIPSNATGTKVRASFVASEQSNFITETTLQLEAVNGTSILGTKTSPRYQLPAPPGNGIAEEWSITATAAQINSPAFGIKLKAQDNGPASTFGIGNLQVEVTYSAPMFYKNRVLIASTVKTIVWGTTTLTAGTNSFTCSISAIATVHNELTGGLGGLGAWESPCGHEFGEAPACEAKGREGVVEPTGQVNWSMATLAEPLVQINGIGLKAGCTGEALQSFTGSLTPSFEQPQAIGSGPAKLDFANSGELKSPPPEERAKVTGKLNVMGWDGAMIGTK